MNVAASRSRRSAFTAVELLLASVCTAGVAGAGMTMVVAVSYGAGSLQSSGVTANQGHTSVERISKAVRTGRLVGYYDTDRIVNWYDDKNGDDKIQLSETELFWLHAGSKELRRTRAYRSSMSNAEIAASDAELTPAELAHASCPSRITGSGSAESVTLTDRVTSFQVKGNGSPGAANLLDLRLTTTDDNVSKRFAACCTPRASADYLMNAADYKNDYAGGRMRRKNSRRWAVPATAVVAW